MVSDGYSGVSARRILACVACVALVVGLVSPAGAELVAHWPFEGNADEAVSGYDGAPSGGPTYAAGKTGQAVVLNGTDQYFDTTSAGNLRFQGEFTASAWINPDATNADRTILGTDQAGNNVGLHLVVRDGRAHLGFYGNDTGGSRTIPTGQWTHVAWQYDAGTQRIWVNRPRRLPRKRHGQDRSLGQHPILRRADR